jgi:hypothetical protein
MRLELFLTKLFNKTDEEIKALIYEGEGDAVKIKDNADQVLIDLYSEQIVKNNKKNEGWMRTTNPQCKCLVLLIIYDGNFIQVFRT